MKLKRWIALILSAMMLLSMLPAAQAVDNNSTKITGSCPSEDAQYRNNGHHMYYAEVSEPWCETSGTVWWNCVYCGDMYEEYLPPLGHDWHDDWFTIEEATCTTSGSQVRYCHRCQKQDIRTVPALGHDFGDWKVDEAPTCTEKGLKYRTCKRCGYQEWLYIDALGHLWDEGVITREPTPEKDGEKTYTCQRNSAHKYYEPIPYQGGPTTPPVPAGNPIDLELTMTKISPDKPTYQLNDTVDYLLTMTNTGTLDMPRPGFNFAYYVDDGQKVEWVTSYDLGISELKVDESVSTVVTVPVNDRAVSFHKQVILAQGYADIPAGAFIAPEQDDRIETANNRLWTTQLSDEIPVDDTQPEYALELTVEKIGPIKTAYQLNDQVEYKLTLKNIGALDLKKPGFVWTYLITAGSAVEWIWSTDLGIDVLPVNGSVSANILVPINDRAIELGEQRISVQGFTDIPEKGSVAPEQAENVVNDKFWTTQQYDTLPVDETQPDYALELTVVQTSPAKPAYAENEIVEFDVTLTNASSASVFEANAQRTDYYTSYVVEYYYKTGTFVHDEEFIAGESFTGHCAYQITHDDVVRGDVTLCFFGDAWQKADADPVTESNLCLYADPVYLTLPTKELEYALQLTVVQTSPAKPLYAEDDMIMYHGTLTNVSDEPVQFPYVTVKWVENDMEISTIGKDIVLQPNESFEFDGSESIIEQDVWNGHLTLSFEGVAEKVSSGEKVLSNTVTLQWPTTDEPPEPIPGNYSISLSVTKHNPKSQYPVDGYGYTEEIPYHVVVTNTGDEPIDFDELLIYYTSSNIMHIEPTQRLYPGDPYGFDVYGIFLSENDVAVKDPDPEIIGDVDVAFIAYGRYPDTSTDACTSNEVLINHTLVEPEWHLIPESSFNVEKVETSYHVNNPNGYMVNEMITYDIIVTNTSDVPIHEVHVFDNLEYHSDQIIVTLYDMQPHESRVVPFQHIVDLNDVSRGWVTNWAYVTWEDPETKTEQWQDSFDVDSPTTDLPIPGGLMLTKEENGGPDNGVYYVPGEEINFIVTVTNTMDVAMSDVTVYDDMAYDYPGFIIAQYASLAPHETKTISFQYTPDDYDAEVMGYVANTAYGHGLDPSYADKYGTSNTVVVPVHKDPPKKALLLLTKEETSKPANEMYYTVNETIEYTITAENVGEVTLYDVALFDTLDTSMNEFAHFGILPVGDKKSEKFYHTVSEYEVEHYTYLVNYAIADFWAEGDPGFYSTYAGPVISPLAEKIIKTPIPPFLSDGEGDSCKLTLKGAGAYSIVSEQHYCAAHKQCVDQVNALVSQTGSAQDAWQQAADIWRKALDDEYDAIIKAANGMAKAALMEEKTAFYLYLASYETLLTQLHPGETDQVYKALSDLMMKQCSELCYLKHNGGKIRPDSLLTSSFTPIEFESAAPKCLRSTGMSRNGETAVEQALCEEHGAIQKAAISQAAEIQSRVGAEDTFRRIRRLWQTNLDKATNLRYRAADGELRQAIGQNRTLFDQLIEKRTAVLTQLYSANPEIVAEVLSNMMRDQVLSLCEIW